MSNGHDSNPGTGTDWTVVEQRLYDPSRADATRPDLTAVVVDAVAAAEAVDSREVSDPPLHDVVDVTAIETALFHGARTATPPEGALHFAYRDHRVTVRADGWVQVADPADARR